MRPQTFVRWLLLIFISLLLAACAKPERIWLNAPDWSRAQDLGATVTGDAPVFALGPNNETLFLLAADKNGRIFPRAILLEGNGEKRWQHDYPEIGMARPDKPRAYWVSHGVQLFWISNEQLYSARIDPATGEMPEAPQKLSGEHRVGDYAVAINTQNEPTVWFAGPRTAPGLYRLDANNQNILVDAKGIWPELAFDSQGALHALWAQQPMGQFRVTIQYLPDARQNSSPEAIQTLAEPRLAASSRFLGPELGLTNEQVYIFWSIEVHTGPAAGSVETNYLNFPNQHPQAKTKPTLILIPRTYQLSYRPPHQAGLQAGARAPLQSHSTGKITQIHASRSNNPELVIIFRALVDHTMRNDAYQISTLFFREGQPDTYQLLSFTGSDSRSPFILPDADTWLHASWLERDHEKGFRVLYASTHPDVRANYAKLSSQDYQALAAKTTFGLISGALLIPFALMWMFVPLVLYILTFFLRRGSNAPTAPGTLASLGIPILGYWFIKVAFMGAMIDYVPFSAWLPIIPPWMALPLQIGIPAFILLFSLWMAWLATYRRDTYSSMLFLLTYLAVDAVLSTAIYGPLIFATN